MSQTLTNKLIHKPTLAIREANADGRTELLEYCRTLFGLSETSSQTNSDTYVDSDNADPDNAGSDNKEH